VVARPDATDPFTPVRDPDYGFADIVEFCNLAEVTTSAAGTDTDTSRGDAASSTKTQKRTPKQDAQTLRGQVLEHVTAGKKVMRELRGIYVNHPRLLDGEDPDLWQEELKPAAEDTAWMINAVIRDLEIDQPDETFDDDDCDADPDQDEGEDYR
jgi:hypothetical protein